ncbi:FBXL2 [Symbiodinium microadriaticum]|nr:FBXL2 [Symbiodinium microadriaticum]
MSSLNICGLSSVTDIGTTAICANCWKMAHLNLEDVYLLADRSFFFDRVADGRVAADENMLSSLVTLIVKDCVHISDQALVGLQKRCGKIEVLNLQGCHKLTDKGLAAMYECFDDDGTNSMFPMCDSFRTLVLSSCINLTANGLATLFERCGVLENLDLSGITAVTDSLIADLCRACPTVQRLALRRCVAITDTAICTMASELWLEHLDISYCSKLTDCAIEVLSMACNGLVSLTAVRVRRLTNKAINMLLRNCRLLKKVDLRECESINWKLLDEFSNGYPGVNITHDGNN